ncbi:MAG: phosphoribosyltransferase family protein [Conexivisphaerales archaeon]
MTAKIAEETSLRERTFVFGDRTDGGMLLSKKLRQYAARSDALVLAAAAGGVPVGHVVATELDIPMEVIVIRKIQLPWDTESGFGAMSFDGDIILNLHLVRRLGLSEKTMKECISKTRNIIQERLSKYRGGRPLPELKDKVVIIVDDGLASGYTMLAAARSVRKGMPRRLVIAAPTGSSAAIELLASEVDEIVCLNIRSGPFFAVADAYSNWYDLTDDDVLEILKRPRPPRQP